MKLSLGCGAKIQTGDWLNHDRLPREGIDLSFDLTVFPWPCKYMRGSIEHILAEDVLEHIPCHLTLAVMDECWGLLKRDGTMAIQVPVFGSRYHLADLTHCRGFSLESFDILDSDTPVGKANPWYTDRKWTIDHREQDNTPLDVGTNLHFLLHKRS